MKPSLLTKIAVSSVRNKIYGKNVNFYQRLPRIVEIKKYTILEKSHPSVEKILKEVPHKNMGFVLRWKTKIVSIFLTLLNYKGITLKMFDLHSIIRVISPMSNNKTITNSTMDIILNEPFFLRLKQNRTHLK